MVTTTTKPAAAKTTKAAPAAAKKTVAAKAAPVTAKKVAPVAKAAAPLPAVPSKVAAVAPAAKPAKVKKQKMVRDNLTMPKAEYEVLDALKQRATKLQTHAKKTELVRAGIKALAAMGDTAFLAAVAAVPSLKTGRPKKS
ncbi:MAG: hypothetical protein WCK83_12425 [Burkholderiales bacterium]